MTGLQCCRIHIDGDLHVADRVVLNAGEVLPVWVVDLVCLWQHEACARRVDWVIDEALDACAVRGNRIVVKKQGGT